MAAQAIVLVAALWITGASGKTFLLLFVAFTAISYWMARKLIFPLARLMVKARQGRTPDAPGVPDELGADSSDEWADLETVVDRMRRDLRDQSRALARERHELSTLLAAVSEAILAVDVDGKPLFYNSKFALAFGGKDFAKRRPTLGEIFRAPDVLKAFKVALTEGDSRTPHVRLHALGEVLPRYFALSVAPLKRDDGLVYGAVGIFHDVTELKQAERIRIDFVANVSHELRTPLTAIKGYADTLHGDFKAGDTAQAQKHLAVIDRNVERLMALIGDLLDLSSLEAEGAAEGEEADQRIDRFRKERVDTRALTERVFAGLDRKRHELGAEFEVMGDAATVWADARRLEQVLTNLVENALKYGRAPGGASRSLIQVRWEEGPRWVRLHVRDQGPGIPPEHQPRLFERFYRVDPARSQHEVDGTGLGLAIVKHILQRHGGSVWVHSEVGQGADFVCEFPKDELVSS